MFQKLSRSLTKSMLAIATVGMLTLPSLAFAESAYLEVTSGFFVPVELALGGWFTAMAMRFLRLRTPASARVLFLTSIVYLPLLLGAIVLTKL